MNIRKVRADIERFVEGKMENQNANLQEVNLLETARCPMINPICPGDLCILPAGHPGAEDGIHVLGTDPYDQAFKYNFPLAPYGTSDRELVRLGWLEQTKGEIF